jgi:hypothetical protein
MSTTTIRPEEHLPFVHDPSFVPNGDANTALEVQTAFRGVMIGSHLVDDIPQPGPGRFVHGLARRATFVVGGSAKADAPAASDLLGCDDLPLVSKWSGGFLVQVTPQMTGTIEIDGKVSRLADYLKGRGSNFTLPSNARARIDCGAMSFRLEHTTRAPSLPRPWFRWRWAEQKFTLASFLALGLFVLMSFVLPPEGATVSNELLGMDRKMIPLLFLPPEPAKVPQPIVERADKTGGESGKPHIGDPGKAGDKNAKRRAGAVAIQGDGRDMHLGKAEAAAAVLDRGILGFLRSTQSAQFADIFGRESAVGNAKENVLGNLASNDLAAAYGAGGLTLVGTGSGGAGTNLRTFGVGTYNTLGGTGYGGGPATGGLRRHITRAPEITQGNFTIRGSLDKEIIRRVVHLHMKEVKYCYDKELGRKASLAGRISVNFVISSLGQVISSVLQSTTMNDLGVESCVVGAIKRWEFPKPTGGGIAIVSYPFNFVAGS